MQSISSKYGPIVVSVIVALTFGLVMYVLLTKAVPAADSDLMKILTGGLSAKFSDIVSFWTGSSSGSKAKDEVISNQASPPAT
jgi:hypothetical protein